MQIGNGQPVGAQISMYVLQVYRFAVQMVCCTSPPEKPGQLTTVE